MGLYLAVAGRPAASDPPAPALRLREEFSRLVLGKGEAEVVAAVGPPDRTTADDNSAFWHYKRRTRGPLTGGIDTDVQVVLQGGRVIAINY